MAGDKIADLYLRVDTYNGLPIPREKVLKQFGVHTHRIVVNLAGGKLSIRDLR